MSLIPSQEVVTEVPWCKAPITHTCRKLQIEDLRLPYLGIKLVKQHTATHRDMVPHQKKNSHKQTHKKTRKSLLCDIFVTSFSPYFTFSADECLSFDTGNSTQINISNNKPWTTCVENHSDDLISKQITCNSIDTSVIIYNSCYIPNTWDLKMEWQFCKCILEFKGKPLYNLPH